ncbi:DUF4185 domain-containing protein [Flexivirga caeni]|uniref:DUF4185 domain-containing protein n=1 Tax=Flexivirga caeni TaxID=2294115 RepID=A0A3M9M452_9MICO|nr:DUF4185 domain-containing protein [Flexivirga caeni]RNI20292.1 DUF4185 domain-containing protein [Flexivirga caeni]
MRSRLLGIAGGVVVALVSCTACVGASAPAHRQTSSAGAPLRLEVADAPTVRAGADGDLWPNCWASDGALYAAYGDGKGFGGAPSDIGVTRITGTPETGLHGTNLAQGNELGQVWSGAGYTRKPTGMACVGNRKYLAIEDLAPDFNKAPASTIASSTDGVHWKWDTTKPMFSGGVFTTVMFLDYGKADREAPGDYVYAYGLDGNWRDSYSHVVPDPTQLFLARVPRNAVQDRAKWEFYQGSSRGKPVWGSAIADKRPVLTDTRRSPQGNSVISQGGIVYVPALRTYVYTSWSENTFEFYAAPQPWGPWRHTNSVDFGAYPWTTAKFGGYGLSLPSKFIAPNGRTAWLQSNVCPCAPAGMSDYDFSLRTVRLVGSVR